MFLWSTTKAPTAPKNPKNKNVDTGMGLERTVAVLNGYDTVYQIDVFKKAKEILDAKEKEGEKQKRIILDHMRTAVFLLGDIKESPRPMSTKAMS